MKKIIFFALLLSLFWVGKALAAEPNVVVKDDSYSVQFVSQSIPDPVVLERGEIKEITIKFKNVGAATWNKIVSRFISAYTMEPRDRQSVFEGSDWISARQTAKIPGLIKPGQIGELKIELKAPQKTGDYLERFYLAAENYTWIKGGYFYLKIKVVPAVKKADEMKAESKTEINADYKLKRQVLSKKAVSGNGGEPVKLIFAYHNQGKSAWQDFSVSADEKFADISWQDEKTIISGEIDTAPDGFLRREIYFRLPPNRGSYTLELTLQIDSGEGQDIISLPVEVLNDAPAGYQAPFAGSQTKTEAVQAVSAWIGEEPRIRVGIAAPESNFLQFRSYEDEYRVLTNGKEMGVLPMRKFAVIKFIDGQYSFSAGGLEFTSPDYIRLEPVNNFHAVYHLPNLVSRTAKWVNPNKLFNYYRGALEYRQGLVDKKLYIVNDLLLEDYVRGMSENSRSAPLEFVKANLVAARTYAYVARGKYPFFDVLGSTYDQLYLGYEAEEELPNVQEAVMATRGAVVTYNGQAVTTPYFGNSSGWTKNWKSVWGGANKPWLVPVRANYDAGKRQNGHGVGMSQLDAYNRAKEEGLDYIALLKYYYTGVEVEKIY